MIVVVTGSRTIAGPEQIAFVHSVMEQAPVRTVFYHGDAKGLDSIVKEHTGNYPEAATGVQAYSNKAFPAVWKPLNADGSPAYRGQYDASAGHKRNAVMIDAALEASMQDNDGLPIVLAFCDKPLVTSKGTLSCVQYALSKGLTVRYFRTDLHKQLELV